MGEFRVEKEPIKTKGRSSEPKIVARRRTSDVLQVNCLQENAMLPKRGSEGVVGYDLTMAYNYAIPSQGKGIVQNGICTKHPT